MVFLMRFGHNRIHTGPLGGYISRLGFKMPPPRDNFHFSRNHIFQLYAALTSEQQRNTQDLMTRNTQLAVSGLYYWVVESEGRSQIGKLTIIK